MEDVRRMDLHDVKIMHGYWKRNIPLRALVSIVAVAMGVKPEHIFPQKSVKEMGPKDFDLTPGPRHMTEQEFRKLMAATGGKIEGVGQYNG